jgi:hypothetical protein
MGRTSLEMVPLRNVCAISFDGIIPASSLLGAHVATGSSHASGLALASFEE